MSRELIRLTSSFLNRPLLITPTELTGICDYLLEGRNQQTVINLGADIRNTPTDSAQDRGSMTVANGVAHLQVIGSLSHRSMGLDSLCGAGVSSYNAIRRNIDLALADDSVKVVLMELDTNGGEAAGCFDLARYIKKASAIKPIIGYASEKALSAGYAIISACSEVIVPESGELGSIGVVAIHQDFSKRLTREGIKITPLYCGKEKVMGNSFEPLTEDVKEKIMGSIRNNYESFVSLVSANRNIDPDTVRNTEAGVFSAKEAIELGLADEIMSFNEVEDYVRELAANRSSQYGNSSIITQASAIENDAQLSTEESEMALTDQERQELEQLRAEKAAAAETALVNKAESFASFGVEPKAYAEQVVALGADHPFVAMMDSALNSASQKLAEQSELVSTLTAEKEQLTEQLSAKESEAASLQEKADKIDQVADAARDAVEASAAMSELGTDAGGDQTKVNASSDSLEKLVQEMFGNNNK